MSRIFRTDFGSRIPPQLERTGAGALRIPAAVGRVGLLRYVEDGREVIEYRSPKEAFSEAALASLKDVPVTIGHPHDFVTPATVRKVGVGHVSEVGQRAPGRAAELVGTKVVVGDAAAIERVLMTGPDRLVELSAGYSMRRGPGGVTPSGERYDYEQLDIRYNHVALLRAGEGRAGSEVSLKIDQIDDGPIEPTIDQREDSMEEEIDGKVYKIGTAEWGAARARQQARIEGEMAALRQRADAADKAAAEVEALKGQVKRLDGELAAARAVDVDTLVSERAALLGTARAVLGESFRADGLSAHQIRCAVIEKLDGKAVVESKKTEDALAAYFEGRVLAASLEARSDAGRSTQARAALAEPPADTAHVASPYSYATRYGQI